MKTIMWESMPRWFGLSWDPKMVAIRIRLHRDVPLPQEAWDRTRQKLDDLRWNQWSQWRDLPPLNTDFSKGWFGLGEILKIVQHPEYIEFVGKIPRVHIKSRWLCSLCKGQKVDASGESCFDCAGTGRGFYDNLRRADALAISIGILLNPIEYNDVGVGSQESQLLTVHFTMPDHTAAVGGMVSSAFHRWAHQYPPSTRFADVEEAMKAADARMKGKSYASIIKRFRAEIYSEKHHFSLDQCFMGGVWGGPDDGINDSIGYHFYSKDLYTSADQLTFLAGLAALHDRADREIKEQQKTA